MTINCNGELVDLSTPKVMGIINVTPDSFFSGSRVSDSDFLKRVEKMLSEGADFIDIGGYSTRPGALEVSEKEEINRVVGALKLLQKEFSSSVKVSVDTFRSEVARQSLEHGASLINDISAGKIDEKMWDVVAQYQVPYIVMHMRGTPQTMMQNTDYQDIVQEMMFYFSECKEKAQQYGINDLIIDPGFGFSKTLEQNYEVLQKLDYFQNLNCPVLVGMSRKSMLYKLLGTSPEEALNATTSVHTIALLKGANILRVHDVKEAVEVVKIVQQMCQFEGIKINKTIIQNLQK